MPKFVHLHTHSHYSLLDGLPKIPELVARAKELGMDALALTDHGALYGAVEFYKEAKQQGVKAILGVEAYVAPTTRFSREPNEKYYHLVLLAETDEGWKNLIKLTTKAHLEGFYYKPRIDKELLREYSRGLIGLSGCLSGEVNRFLLSDRIEEAKRAALEYEEILGKGNFFLEIGDHPKIPQAAALRGKVIELARATNLPLVATHDIHYLRPEDAVYHDVLLAVQTQNRLSDDVRLTFKADDFSMTSPEEMVEKFSDVPEAVENTMQIADRCSVRLELGRIRLAKFFAAQGITPDDKLRSLIKERASQRFPEGKLTKEAEERLEYELGVIAKTGFADYFLLVQDFVTWAKEHGIGVGPGRGSAAGSIVSYILGITDVNPLRYGLIFERFLNPERIQMPDFDIDFSDTRRDEVLAYVREKYGEDKVAQIITFGTMAARAAVRDAGRAMGLSYAFCDKLAKLIPVNFTLEEAMRRVPEIKELYETNQDATKLLDAARHLEGVARHASVHACGTVISDTPLIEYVPLQRAPQERTRILTQFDMRSIEDLGLLKIDLLGLKNLTLIEETTRLIKERKDVEIDITRLPLDDGQTFALLQRGDTTGVFQFESAGMRRYMKDMKPTEFEDLAALVALFRPGPMELIPSFIRRKHGREPITYLHPKLEPILKSTYGIGVYQEQMMQIARDLAGYTLPEADTLRKAIGKKIKSLLDEQKERLIEGMRKNGIETKVANAIWELFPPFARYGFNKSHAVCYALIGYQTAYLKAHYPEEFTAALLNAYVNDSERIALLIAEAKQAMIEVLPPDVNRSAAAFAPEREGTIRFGLLAIKNVGAHIAETIVAERAKGGTFKDLVDFLSRIQDKDLNKKSLESLVKCGALDSLGVERKQALENIDELVRYSSLVRRAGARGNHNSLFGFGSTRVTFPLKLKPAAVTLPHEKLSWEKELLGFFLSGHPLEAHAEKIKGFHTETVDEVRHMNQEGAPVRIAALVSKIQRIVTKKGNPMLFATVEDFGPNPIEVIVFNNTLPRTAHVWRENAAVLVEGRVSLRSGVPKVICENARALDAD